MTMLTILQFPDPRLTLQAEPVDSVTPEIKQIIDDMFETMYNTPNTAALAATQLDIQKRIVVMDISMDKSEPQCFINPVLTNPSDEQDYEKEGCLSVEFAEFSAAVWRPTQVHLDALNQEGEPISIDCTGFFARCIQHEVDHLDGKLFIDYLSPLKRKRLEDKIKKWKKSRKKRAQ